MIQVQYKFAPKNIACNSVKTFGKCCIDCLGRNDCFTMHKTIIEDGNTIYQD